MMNCKIGILVCIAFTVERCQASLIAVPTNKMVFLKTRTELQASTNSNESINWWFTSSNSWSYTTPIFIHGNLTTVSEAKYKVDRSTSGHYDLVIESVDMSYAGKYKCTEGSYGTTVEVELAVIDPQPLCRTNSSTAVVEKDFLWLQCSISFAGNTILHMNWMRNSTGNVIPDISNHVNQSTLVIQVDSSDNGETFTFEATFTQENNPLQVVVKWNHTVNVLYTPRNIAVCPKKTVYEVGDLLECSADGNPTPSYQWTDINTNETTNGSFLTISEYMKKAQNHTFRCTAYNTEDGLGRHISHTVTFSLIQYSTPAGADSSDVLIGSVVTIILLCTVIVIVLLVCRRLKAKVRLARPERLPEPDVVSNEMYMTHYCDIADLSNEGAAGMTVMSPGCLNARQVEPSFPLYDLIRGEDNETATGGLSSPQQVPTYTEVKKKDKGQGRINGEILRAEQQMGVYSEIPETNLLSKTHQVNNNSCDQSSAKSKVKPTNYFGADGTEYAEVNSFPEERPAAPIQRPPMFLPVENYASIDHTQRALPPPPRL